ncbi:MAG TPA: UDP-2,3-diacylglucosamine diphosphatase [Bdellovibrionales bacterium]|nr:UDP-2,3-diacylglucosamine diphosphatase [Bdellovibrionales bacterium]
MSRALFVSDIHIKSAQDPKCVRFIEFLQKAREIQPGHLFLVGDIFDLWIADRAYFVEGYRDVIAELKALHDAGTEIHYFEGNHDLDLKRFWEDRMGFRVHDGPAYFDLDGWRVRVEHGDQMDPDDSGYLFLRWLLRTWPMRRLGRYLPNSSVRMIGERASHASRDYTSNVKVASDDQAIVKIRSHAIRAYREKPFDLIVSGHVHVLENSRQENFACVNLGTWLKEPYVLDLEERNPRLRSLQEFLGS